MSSRHYRLPSRVWSACLTLTALLPACATPTRAPPDGASVSQEAFPSTPLEAEATDGAREVALRFLDAAEQGDFEKAYALLTTPLRQRYTAETFERDFRRDPLARARLVDAREAVQRAAPIRSSAGVVFAIDSERALRLVEEEGRFRVAAIE